MLFHFSLLENFHYLIYIEFVYYNFYYYFQTLHVEITELVSRKC